VDYDKLRELVERQIKNGLTASCLSAQPANRNADYDEHRK